MYRTYGSMVLGVLLSALPVGVAAANDLALKDVTALRVGPCSDQVRFQVELQASGAQPWHYQIEVRSAERKKLLKKFTVKAHKPKDTLLFVVPSDLLVCDQVVDIVVDPTGETRDTNPKNNTARARLDVSRNVTPEDPCYVPPQRCP